MDCISCHCRPLLVALSCNPTMIHSIHIFLFCWSGFPGRSKKFWKENLITDQKHRWKWQKNFSFQFRMSSSGGNDFWVTHFSRIQASLSKMFNLENDRRKVMQRRRAAKKSWELSLGSLIVCSTGCRRDKNLCDCVDVLTLCWIFNFLL